MTINLNRMEDFMCNVLVMGKTGTGKSTLLNYICDSKVAETGTGKPVTGEGIYDYVVNINNQEVRIFDSWGIEAGKVERWKGLIQKSLEEHGTQKSIQDWFHSIIYCIQAGGGRVEDVDVEIVRQFLSEGYKITIVLTKADQVSEDDEALMKKTISSEICVGAISLTNNLNIIATCAEKKVTRSGETNPFGREEVCSAILTGWRDTVMERLPKHVIARICEYINDEVESLKELYSRREISGLAEDNEAIYIEIREKADDIASYINTSFLPAILEEVSQSCKKANMSLEAMLDVKLADVAAKEEVKMEWWMWPILSMPTTWIGLAIHFVKDFFRARSEKNIREQRDCLNDYLDAIGNELKSKYQAKKEYISQQLKSAL